MIVNIKKYGGVYKYNIECEIPQVATLFAGFLYACAGVSGIDAVRSTVKFQARNKKLVEDHIRRFTSSNPMVRVQFSNDCPDC